MKSTNLKNILSQLNSKTLGAHIKALRMKQWTKNLVVFAAPLFAFEISVKSLFGSLLAFFLFCAASSSFYLLNDIFDVKSDRQHPVKSKRPIASGLVTIPTAIGMAICLQTFALVVSWLNSPALGLTILGYALLQIAYNLRLKRAVIFDIIVIATGFLFRAFAGAAATDITLSTWFLLCIAMLALFLAIEKRKAELRLADISKKKTRKVLQSYSLPLLNRMESLVTNGTVITYMLWSAGPTLNGASTPWMMLTLPFVIYGVFRYQYLSDPQEIARRSSDLESGGQTERPEEVLLNDRSLRLNILTWVIALALILFFKKQGFIT
ncbi:MAG: decaprenyl-phosphate phosphoribosyltransferase [Acaryochloridaceae cyanobacterium CSU_3_4]|nr:decaprenyl-phosphate phosphoribosyltransferase [Acaryochloridaceae cyanobacterium CSU_3_4]